MTVAAIVATLAKEFSIEEDRAGRAIELLQAGFKAPYVARYRRAEIGTLSEGMLRRFERRLRQLEELERRRRSLLRTLDPALKAAAEAGDAAAEEQHLARLSADPRTRATLGCMDPRELEDLFLPHRRPEPEVQLALDRGLGALADRIVEPLPGAPDEAEPVEEESDAEAPEVATPDEDHARPELFADESAPEEHAHEPLVEEPHAEHDLEPSDGGQGALFDQGDQGDRGDEGDEGDQSADGAPEDGSAARHAQEAGKPSAEPLPVLGTKLDVTPQLARLCAPFVNPDRGVHTDKQALEGALRVLSDRLGRSPHVRNLVRKLVRKHGRLHVRALVDEKRLGRNRSLLKLNASLRQVQGHKLLALRQAQMQRLVTTSIEFDRSIALPKLRAALSRRPNPEHAGVIDAVVAQALEQRILPMIEEDVRNELRERAEEEALRFLAQYLRQTLLAPVAAHRPVAGLDVNPKGDWTIVVLDAQGKPVSGELKIEAAGKPIPELALALAAALGEYGVQSIAVGHGKSARETVVKLREAIHHLNAGADAYVVNEGGLTAYANSELARSELPDWSVPARMAISLGRRYQDPLAELIKSDVRHLGLGRETSVISKANLRRVLHDTVESCVAHVGCEVNHAPLSFLRYVPGLDYEQAKKIVARRAEKPFASREELRELLGEPRWTNAIGFMSVMESEEPLDRSALHPEQYALVRQLLEAAGSSVAEALGKRDGAKGLRQANAGVDGMTWRDIVREIAHPGRDPRLRLFPPRFLQPDADATKLEKGQAVEGIVSNVSSFGVFVDLGIPREGMIHISEISARYVRDARGLLSIGQAVRARVLDASGPRVELSLKDVPEFVRPPRPPEERPARREPARTQRREAPEERQEKWTEQERVQRAARTRRDGLAGTGAGGDRRRERSARGAGKGDKRGGRRQYQDEGFDAAAVRKAQTPAGSYNPFAQFFKRKLEGEASAEA